jgi:hypothetical protein
MSPEVEAKAIECVKRKQVVRSGMRRTHKTLIPEGNEFANGLAVERIRQSFRCKNCPGCTMRTERGTCHDCEGCLAKTGCIEWRRSCHAWPTVYIPGGAQNASSIGSTDLKGVEEELAELKAVLRKFQDFITEYIRHGAIVGSPYGEPSRLSSRPGDPEQQSPNQAGRRRCNYGRDPPGHHKQRVRIFPSGRRGQWGRASGAAAGGAEGGTGRPGSRNGEETDSQESNWAQNQDEAKPGGHPEGDPGPSAKLAKMCWAYTQGQGYQGSRRRTRGSGSQAGVPV